MKSKPLHIVLLLFAFTGCAHNNWEKIDLSVNSDAKIVSSDPEPKYPKKATAEKKSGSAKLIILVDESGKAKEISVVKESPEGFGFGASAFQQASKLKFQPAVCNGKRVKQRFTRIYKFDYDPEEKSYNNQEKKMFKIFDLNNCTDPQLSPWALELHEKANIISDSIANSDSGYNEKCTVQFIVNQNGEIFNLEKNGCELGYKSINKMGHTPHMPAKFKPDTIMVSLEFDPNRIK